MSLRVLAVIVLGCCLVSAVSAFSGGCNACSAAPAGGWGSSAKPEFWGMSAADIMNYAASHANDTSSESASVKAPPLVLPTSNADKFSSLSAAMSRIGESPTIPSPYSGALIPDIMIKPDFSGSAKPDSGMMITSGSNSLFM
jgi:hypothetical protein